MYGSISTPVSYILLRYCLTWCLASVVTKGLFYCVFGEDGSSVELEQLDLQVLCDGLRRYLLDLPQPVIHSAVYTEMVHVAQGENDHVQSKACQSSSSNLHAV